MTRDPYSQLESELTSDGPVRALDQLAERLIGEKRLHELFDVRLMQSRHRLGLPVDHSGNIDALEEPLRSETEQAYLAACREVGTLLLAEQKYREAWMYLRTAGEKAVAMESLTSAQVHENNVEELIELAVHEGIAPEFGFGLVLEHYGTCNAITTFEGALHQQPREDQQAVATLLVKHLHGELMANVRAHIEQHENGSAPETTLQSLVESREWLFDNDNYHIDTSHLSSTVRFARLLESPESLRLAYDLTEYGRRLGAPLQFGGDEPFVDMYVSHGKFFGAQLGIDRDQARAHFSERARAVPWEEEGTAAVETYLVLLDRLGLATEALEAYSQLVPRQMQLSPYAPSLLQLTREADAYHRYLEICRTREDVLGFAAGLVEMAHNNGRDGGAS